MKRCTPIRTFHTSGFTLLEMLAALVLLSLLMMTVMKLIPQYIKVAKELKEHQPPSWCLHLQQLLNEDLARCRTMQMTKQGLELKCPMMSASSNNRAAQSEQTIIYHWEKLPQSAVLMRSTQGRHWLLAFNPIEINLQTWQTDQSEVTGKLTLSPPKSPPTEFKSTSQIPQQSTLSKEVTPQVVSLSLSLFDTSEVVSSSTILTHQPSSINYEVTTNNQFKSSPSSRQRRP